MPPGMNVELAMKYADPPAPGDRTVAAYFLDTRSWTQPPKFVARLELERHADVGELALHGLHQLGVLLVEGAVVHRDGKPVRVAGLAEQLLRLLRDRR